MLWLVLVDWDSKHRALFIVLSALCDRHHSGALWLALVPPLILAGGLGHLNREWHCCGAWAARKPQEQCLWSLVRDRRGREKGPYRRVGIPAEGVQHYEHCLNSCWQTYTAGDWRAMARARDGRRETPVLTGRQRPADGWRGASFSGPAIIRYHTASLPTIYSVAGTVSGHLVRDCASKTKPYCGIVVVDDDDPTTFSGCDFLRPAARGSWRAAAVEGGKGKGGCRGVQERRRLSVNPRLRQERMCAMRVRRYVEEMEMNVSAVRQVAGGLETAASMHPGTLESGIRTCCTACSAISPCPFIPIHLSIAFCNHVFGCCPGQCVSQCC